MWELKLEAIGVWSAICEENSALTTASCSLLETSLVSSAMIEYQQASCIFTSSLQRRVFPINMMVSFTI